MTDTGLFDTAGWMRRAQVAESALMTEREQTAAYRQASLRDSADLRRTQADLTHTASQLKWTESNRVRALDRLRSERDRHKALKFILRRMLFDSSGHPDHATACERTMGATHPCTCCADTLRALLERTR